VEALDLLIQAAACGEAPPPAPASSARAAAARPAHRKLRTPAAGATSADVSLWRRISQLAATLGVPHVARSAAERALVAISATRASAASMAAIQGAATASKPCALNADAHALWLSEQLVALAAGMGDFVGAKLELRRLEALDPWHPW
jgi:hypothetical protein